MEFFWNPNSKAGHPAIVAGLAGISGGFFIEINMIAKRVAFLY
jgi:hypothetical protein